MAQRIEELRAAEAKTATELQQVEQELRRVPVPITDPDDRFAFRLLSHMANRYTRRLKEIRRTLRGTETV